MPGATSKGLSSLAFTSVDPSRSTSPFGVNNAICEFFSKRFFTSIFKVPSASCEVISPQICNLPGFGELVS